jgi:hypothetical protein
MLAPPRFECAKPKTCPSQVRIRAVEGPLLRGCAAADGRETAGYLFRRPGPGCHVARLLDEPTASLDPAATKAIEDVIRSVAARGIKVVMSTAPMGSFDLAPLSIRGLTRRNRLVWQGHALS